ncbi:PepSY-like domain-containing protein [Rufibacter sp. DG15C]|uniref:PepSY-like domain-containing protein n=1 Tax=Rufibacter sp. DG15C TaxID=1379909 RepID=UPI000B29205F|nr:PepSY-like domain-containing protein [Rufibacter sp. DG15C]
MKALWISMLAAGTLLTGCSQKISMGNMPSVVQNGLKTQFPNAANLEWEKSGNLFEAEFDVNQQEYAALVDATGKVMAVKQEIDASQLPAPITQQIQTSHQEYTLDDAEKVERNGQVFYQVELQKPMSELKQVYTAQGATSPETFWD